SGGGQNTLNTFSHRERVFDAGDVLDQQRELISSEPCDGVGLPDAAAEPPSDYPEQLVSLRMPEAIVYDFESVEIDEQHSDTASCPIGARKGVPQPVHEEQAVGQSRQCIMESIEH